jgi:hypothetical protein
MFGYQIQPETIYIHCQHGIEKDKAKERSGDDVAKKSKAFLVEC